jgi:phage N-6-adenine-methyltransferase
MVERTVMINAGLMSSNTDGWATPQHLFDELNAEFGFTLDVCASTWNHKCANYYTAEQDGLAQEWSGVCWMNPPYGRTIGKWMAKALEASRGGQPLFVLYQLAPTQHGGGIMRWKVKSVSFVAESSSSMNKVTAMQPHSLAP